MNYENCNDEEKYLYYFGIFNKKLQPLRDNEKIEEIKNDKNYIFKKTKNDSEIETNDLLYIIVRKTNSFENTRTSLKEVSEISSKINNMEKKDFVDLIRNKKNI